MIPTPHGARDVAMTSRVAASVGHGRRNNTTGDMIMSETTAPRVENITRHAGIAGQYETSCEVTYPGEPMARVSFVANTSGGPVVMVTPHGQIFVSRAVTERLGEKVTAEWVRAFFTDGTSS